MLEDVKLKLKSLLSIKGNNQHKKTDDAHKQLVMLIAFAGSAILVTFIIGHNLWDKTIYQYKVNEEAAKYEAILKENVAAISKIKNNVNALKADDALNLGNLKTDDKTPLQVVLDALPTSSDNITLGSSLQNKVFLHSKANVSLAVSGADNKEKSSKKGTGVEVKPSSMKFNATITGSVSAVKDTLETMERTIRPINITDLDIRGTDDAMTVDAKAKTYYAPKVNYKLGSTEVNP